MVIIPKPRLLAQSIISEDIFDIRIICYFLFGVFTAHGPAELPDIMEAIKGISTENWDATGPLKNKEKQFKNSFKWLFRQMVKSMTYEEKKQSHLWLEWQNSTDSDMVQITLDLCSELQQILSDRFQDADSQLFDVLSKIKAWLNTFYKLVYKEPEPEPEPEPEFESESETESEFEETEPDDESEEFSHNEQVTSGGPAVWTNNIANPVSDTMENRAADVVKVSSQSAHLILLLKKNQGF